MTSFLLLINIKKNRKKLFFFFFYIFKVFNHYNRSTFVQYFVFIKEFTYLKFSFLNRIIVILAFNILHSKSFFYDLNLYYFILNENLFGVNIL